MFTYTISLFQNYVIVHLVFVKKKTKKKLPLDLIAQLNHPR